MRVHYVILTVLVLTIAVTGYLYPQLPDQIPLHFDIHGEVDRWGGRESIWLTALLPVGIYGLLHVIPHIDPRKDSYAKHERGFAFVKMITTLFLVSIHGFILAFSMGYQADIRTFVFFSVGIVFLSIGNHLPNARQNYTFGIRNPWTLHNEVVWKKTHRVGGWMFAGLGLLSMLAALFSHPTMVVVFVVATVLVALGINVYSYLVHRRLET